ncbi:5-carboxymethyl-2-hydroxymuconate isomerase [Rhizobacter sp. AJA081-3]|uniref:5-carboxymethyl-2-hydroxymuconate isomerase n=1 Tax=Rhizobacter sp. AJA081-3 TaxID=2753607 RepID=UPI001ADFE204|nr:5-carboxymethyl-2-hydroxymuconate isomerase [Rhizobacter sp. AJA081-3]QTN25725.1 5-carboxymethyl-2-hydroxymuconate isomerase [Rhizobacter sp. AJA081-3]
MPHMVVLYSPNLDPVADIGKLCRSLADEMLTIRDERGQQVLPAGGVRVLAYAADHAAIADGEGDYAFVYLNLRLGRGRSADVKRRIGEQLAEVARRHFEPLMGRQPTGVTLQIDEGQEVFDHKYSTLHPLFADRK